MKLLPTLKIISAALALSLTSSIAFAQSTMWSAEQAEVWQIVEQSWVDEVANNKKWPADYLVDDAVSWGATWPSPRSKTSIIKWSRFNDTQSETLQYENIPVSIVIHDDTAVVMYTNVSVAQSGKEKPERSTGGTIETLVRTEDGWKFIALTGFDTTPK